MGQFSQNMVTLHIYVVLIYLFIWLHHVFVVVGGLLS